LELLIAKAFLPDRIFADHGLRLDDDQGFEPAFPQPAEDNPEQPIEAIQFGPRVLPLEDGELLAKRATASRASL
jgi:hypothetical protein